MRAYGVLEGAGRRPGAQMMAMLLPNQTKQQPTTLVASHKKPLSRIERGTDHVGTTRRGRQRDALRNLSC